MIYYCIPVFKAKIWNAPNKGGHCFGCTNKYVKIYSCIRGFVVFENHPVVQNAGISGYSVLKYFSKIEEGIYSTMSGTK